MDPTLPNQLCHNLYLPWRIWGVLKCWNGGCWFLHAINSSWNLETIKFKNVIYQEDLKSNFQIQLPTNYLFKGETDETILPTSVSF
jgi:hypothetical protein